MATNPTTVQHCMRLYSGTGLMVHAITAPVFGMRYRGAGIGEVPVIGLGHGRIGSISRGSLPPKKR